MKDEVWAEVLEWIDYAAPTRIKRKAWELNLNTIEMEADRDELLHQHKNLKNDYIKFCDEGVEFADKVLATIKYVREHP